MKILYIFAALIALSACQAEPTAKHSSANDVSSSVTEQEAVAASCLNKNGVVTIGGHGQLVCIEKAKDAGKQCSSSKDCAGICLAEGQICSAETEMYGCHDVYEDGQIATLCVD